MSYMVEKRTEIHLFTPNRILETFKEYELFWLDQWSVAYKTAVPKALDKIMADTDQFDDEFATIPDTLEMLVMAGTLRKIVPQPPMCEPVYQWIGHME